MGNVPSSWTRRMVPGAGAATHAAEPAPEARPLTTFFDDGCQIDGRLVVRTSIEIDSEFRGRIESEQTVTVGPERRSEAWSY